MMKKYLHFAMVLGAVVTLGVSCNKKDITPDSPASPAEETVEKELVTITVGAPEDMDTKVTYEAEEEAGNLKVKWENGDKIVVVSGETSNTFTASEISEDGKMATFTGTKPGEAPYTIFYAGKGETAKTLDEVKEEDYSVQTQSGNGSTAHLHFAAILEGVDTYENIYFKNDWAAEHHGTFKQSGAIRIRIQKPEGFSGKVESVTLKAPSAVFYKNNGLKDAEKTNAITVKFAGGVDVSSETHIVAYAMLPWGDLTLAEGDYQISVRNAALNSYVKSTTIGANVSLNSSSLNLFGFNKNGFEYVQRYAGGSGVEGDPLLIANAQQLFYMKEDLEASDEGATTYFALVADIDMSSNEQLAGINAATPYKIIHLDGRNHKISNLKITNTSGYNGGLFGVLYGTLKNLTIANPEVTSSSKSTGIIACWAGANDETTWAKLENVKVQGGSITQNNTTQVGGIAGKARNVTFTDCSVQGVTITTTTCAASGSGDNGYGGIAGWAHTCTFKGCSFDGTLNGARLTGGIAGYAAAAVNFEDCQTAGTIKVSKLNNRNGEVGGGIVGWWGGSYVRGCSSTANVTTENNVSGGIVGQVGVNGGVIEKCTYSTGTIQSGGNNAGGIVAYCEKTATVQKCFFNGTVQSGASNAGGIVAVTNNSYASTVTNCYSSGYVKIPKGQCAGGIVGELGTKSVVTNCYSTSEMDGQRCMGGIVGRANSGGWTANAASGNTISGCIAWNPHIICTDRRDANTAGGSGTIVGFTSVKNILTGGYRKADIVFVPSDSDYDGSGVDQPDCDGTNWTMGVTPGTGKTYQCPYHGTAAAATATVSSVAQSLGWDASVWDFSGALPTLK